MSNRIQIVPRKVPPPVVKSRIEESLKRQARLGASRIHVEATDGKVVLSATVDSLAERKEVEKTAWDTEGVTDVENQITISA